MQNNNQGNRFLLLFSLFDISDRLLLSLSHTQQYHTVSFVICPWQSVGQALTLLYTCPCASYSRD